MEAAIGFGFTKQLSKIEKISKHMNNLPLNTMPLDEVAPPPGTLSRMLRFILSSPKPCPLVAGNHTESLPYLQGVSRKRHFRLDN